MSYARAVVALLRELRSDRALIISIAVIVLLTSGLAAAVPRLYNRVLDAELRQRVEAASSHQRSISASMTQRYNNPKQEIRARLAAMGSDYREALPKPLGDVLAEPTFAFESPAFLIADGLDSAAVPFARMIQVRYERDMESQVEMSAGRLPRPREPVVAPANDALPENLRGTSLPVLEIAFSEQTARQLEVQPGDRMLAVFDDAETIFEKGPGNWFLVEVSGTFRSRGAGDLSFDLVSWREDPASLPMANGRTQAEVAAIGTALLAPGAYLEWMKVTELAEWSYDWHLPLDPAALNATNYREVAAQAGSVEVTKGPYQAPGWMPGRLRVSSPIPLLFRGFAAQTQFTLSVIALTALGVFGTAAVAFALLGALISERRRAATILIRGRGATRLQLIGARLLEGILLCGPAAAIGYLVATVLVDARGSRWSIWGAAGVAATMTILLVVSAEPLRVANLGQLLRRSLSPLRQRSRRRLTLEATIVVFAIAALAALRQRGVTAEAGSEVALDPLLVAAPLLLALAVGLLGYRAYPHAIGLLARLAQRGRGLIWFIGLRRGSDPSGTSFLPFIVMLVAVSVAVFASIIAQSVTQAQQKTAWRVVGADARIEAPAFDPDIIGDGLLSNIEIATALMTDGSASAGDDTVQLTAVALDVDAYRRVIGGRQPPFTLPPAGAADAGGIGTEQHPVPAVLSAQWADGERPEPDTILQVGMRIPRFGIVQFFVQVAGSSDRYPSVAAGEPFLIIPLDALKALTPERTWAATTVFVRGPDDAAIAAMIQEQRSAADTPATVEVTSRDDVYAALLEQPLTNAVVTSFQMGAILAALYASLALLVALILTTRRRTYDLSVLRTLGLSLRRATSVIVIEFLPLVTAASLVGVLLGIATAFAIEPGVDLASFTGTEAAIALAINWVTVTLIVLALSAVTLVTIAAYIIWSGRQRLGSILRVSD